MKTRITELFGIQYPIIQGAMQWLSKPRLAAAVSNAGGLGTINMTTYATPEDFQAAIQELKSLTDRPFSVNLSLLPDTKPDGPIKGFLQAVVEEKVKIVETAGRTPADLGQLIYFFEYACGLSGYLLDVNPFDQPGVEAYKKNMFALLGKPGYEEAKAELEKRLAH